LRERKQKAFKRQGIIAVTDTLSLGDYLWDSLSSWNYLSRIWFREAFSLFISNCENLFRINNCYLLFVRENGIVCKTIFL
jgi:hypothetical protein